jgi:cytochrome bd ubiquinol oxidase subunit II
MSWLPSDLTYWLPVIWAGLIGTAVALYVVLDGFDLGIGILFPAADREAERDQMMNSVAPFWDGNETWLILGGGGLFVAFPQAYAIIMPALYIPIILMLLALIFRGVAFEFRWAAKPHHRAWDLAFIGGSIVAAFAQGMVLGGLLQGITVRNGAFAGGPLDWLTPFTVLVGFGTVAGYALLAACWLVMKTDGAVASRARDQAKSLLLVVIAFAGVVSLWTPFQFPRIAAFWFSTPNIFYLWPLPALTVVLAFLVYRWLDRGADVAPFLGVIAIFLLCYAGVAISNFPYLVPPSLDIWQLAAVPKSQMFMLAGTLVLLPLVLVYTAFIYWTFRGKVREGEGYH